MVRFFTQYYDPVARAGKVINLYIYNNTVTPKIIGMSIDVGTRSVVPLYPLELHSTGLMPPQGGNLYADVYIAPTACVAYFFAAISNTSVPSFYPTTGILFANGPQCSCSYGK